MKITIKSMILLLVVFISGCGSESKTEDSGADKSSQDPKPVELKVPQLTLENSAHRIYLSQAAFIDVINKGGDADSCSIATVLPLGLTVKQVSGTCVIYGIAKEVQALSTYQVTASNNKGDHSLDFSITISAEPPLKPSITALQDNNISLSAKQAVQQAFENTGGSASSCVAVPLLPEGIEVIVVDGSCIVVGAALTSSDRTAYQLTASNISGDSSSEFYLTVAENNSYTNDGPAPDDFNYVLVFKENVNPTGKGLSLSQDINNDSDILRIQSGGYPNKILSVETSDNEILTKSQDIEKLFKLEISPSSGMVEIKQQREMDFEQDPAFYQLKLKLGEGTEDIKVLVRLYDTQYGNADEALKISSYAELTSYFNGKFVSDGIGFDLIEYNNTSGKPDNESQAHVWLDRDIDASDTLVSPWQSKKLLGTFSGRGHAISQLKIGVEQKFIANNTAYYDPGVHLTDLALIDVYAQGIIIDSQGSRTRLERVSISGVVDLYSSKTSFRYYSPFVISGNAHQIYSNIQLNLSFAADKPFTRHQYTGGLVGPSSAPLGLGDAYINGSINSAEQAPFVATYGTLGARSLKLSQYEPSLGRSFAVLYSAVELNVTSNQSTAAVGGLIGGSTGLSYSFPKMAGGTTSSPLGSASAQDYPWRFISNRNNPDVVRTTAYGYSDENNDGLFDRVGGIDLPGIDMTDAQAKNIAQYQGSWPSSTFDLTEDEYPVLKNMPYPHVHGASWMSASDPGVAYQRATFDRYLSDGVE